MGLRGRQGGEGGGGEVEGGWGGSELKRGLVGG